MSVFPDFPRVRERSGVWVVDTFHNGLPGTIAVFVVPLPEGGFAMVESGPGSTLENVEAGVAAAGLALGDLRVLLLTHIHLDHAGAAGALAARTGAEVVVHTIGAPHLIDPGRLVSSARRIYGEAMDELWGDMEAVPRERLRPVEGGETLALGGLEVRVLYTPGHASHHVSYLFPDGTLFTGDSAGIRLPGSTLTRPALPPPELSLEDWEASVTRMRGVAPRRLMLTHFGEVLAADEHLAELPERNRAWAAEVLAGLRAGEQEPALVERVERLEDAELERVGANAGVRLRNKVTSDAAMTVMGVSRYWRKRHPERLNGAA
jgi:glyoxylase-like metal-dependent hydrolase (beta-lactamase superfamily II)